MKQAFWGFVGLLSICQAWSMEEESPLKGVPGMSTPQRVFFSPNPHETMYSQKKEFERQQLVEAKEKIMDRYRRMQEYVRSKDKELEFHKKAIQTLIEFYRLPDSYESILKQVGHTPLSEPGNTAHQKNPNKENCLQRCRRFALKCCNLL